MKAKRSVYPFSKREREREREPRRMMMMIMTGNKRDVFFHIDDWKQRALDAQQKSAFGLYIVFVEFTKYLYR